MVCSRFLPVKKLWAIWLAAGTDGIIWYFPVSSPSGSPLKVAGREKLFQTIFSNPLGFSPFLSANKKAPFMGN